MTNLHSSQWISSNISLTGFTRSTAAFMTCKELLENSIDATRDTLTPRIDLSMDLHEDYLRITCADNGRGFASESVDAIHTMFRSSRMGEASAAGTGKFGIGLKAMVVMSNLECRGKDVSIQSQAKDAGSSITFNIGCCDLGEVVIKSFEVGDSISMVSGYTTIVTVFAPKPTNVDCYSEVCLYSKELTSGFLNPALCVKVKFGDQEASFVFSEIPRSILHNDSSGVVSSVISLLPCTGSPSRIFITRFVNGVPLITTNATETNCCILVAVLGGLKKLANSIGVVLSGSLENFSVVSFALSVSGKPQACTWGSICVRVNLTLDSDRIEYSCLTKSSVANSNFELLLARFFRTSFKRMQSRFPTQFQSMERWELKQAYALYIPLISKNISEMIANCSPEVRETILRQLDSDDFENRIKQILTQLITD